MKLISQPADAYFGEISLEWNKAFSALRSEQMQQAQCFIDNMCIKLMVPYTPMLTGALYKSATLGTVIGSGSIKYNSPYARYQYYGKLMVSSITGSAYATAGESKVLTDKDLVYNKSAHPLAGRFWFERMKADHKEQILRGAIRFVGGTI